MSCLFFLRGVMQDCRDAADMINSAANDLYCPEEETSAPDPKCLVP